MKGSIMTLQDIWKSCMHNLLFSWWCVKTSKFSKFPAELLAEQIFFHVPEHNRKNNNEYTLQL